MAIAPVTNGFFGFSAASGSALSVALTNITWAAGNFALLVVHCATGGSSPGTNTAKITPPTGWTTIHQAEGMWLGYRFLQTGDSTWSVTNVGSDAMSGEITTFTGVDTTNPVDVFAFAHLRGQGPQGYAGGLCPPLAPNYANDYLVHVAGCNTTTSSITAPSGWTGLGSEENVNVGVRFSGLQATTAAVTPQVSAGTAVMTSYSPAFSGMVALKTSGDTPVTPPPAFPYLAGTLEATAALCGTGTPIVADFHDVPAPGDLMLVHIVLDTNQSAVTVAPPASPAWSSIAIDAYSLLFYRTAVSGDGGAYNFTPSGSIYAVCFSQTVKAQGVTASLPAVDTSGFNKAAAASPTPTTPALTPSATTDLWLSRIDNDGGTSVTMTYHPSGSNIEDIISFFGPNMSLGHLHLTTNPAPTAYATKSAVGAGNDKAFAMTVKLAATIVTTKQAQQMVLS